METNLKKDDMIITKILIGINATSYAITSIMSGNILVMDYDVIALVGQANFLVFKGYYWQLFTSIFVHINLPHLLGNMLFLLIYGTRGEEFFNKIEFLLIFFISGLIGNLLSLLGGPNMVSAGASGALFGLFGACIMYAHSTIKESLIAVMIYSFYMFFLTMGVNVNLFAHSGGLIAGLALGYLFSKIKPPESEFSSNL